MKYFYFDIPLILIWLRLSPIFSLTKNGKKLEIFTSKVLNTEILNTLEGILEMK